MKSELLTKWYDYASEAQVEDMGLTKILKII